MTVQLFRPTEQCADVQSVPGCFGRIGCFHASGDNLIGGTIDGRIQEDHPCNFAELSRQFGSRQTAIKDPDIVVVNQLPQPPSRDAPQGIVTAQGVPNPDDQGPRQAFARGLVPSG